MRKLLLSGFVALTVMLPQVLRAQIFLNAEIDGSNEVPPVTTTATATAWAILDPTARTLTYQVTYARLQSNYTASHFHVGSEGVAGPVVMPITFAGNTASGVWTGLHDTIITALLKRRVYVNIHTMANPGGEIRGQLNVNTLGFSVNLDGSQEVPPVATSARGTGWVVWEPDSVGTPRLFYRLTIAGLSAAFTAAHFHAGPPGVAGPVVQAISFGGDSTSAGAWVAPPRAISVISSMGIST